MHKRPHSARRGCGPSSEARPGLTTHSTVCLHCCICGSLSRSQFCSCHDTFIYTLSCSAICAVQHRKTSRPYAHRKAEQWSHLLADQKMSHTHLKCKPLSRPSSQPWRISCEGSPPGHVGCRVPNSEHRACGKFTAVL